MKPKVQAQRKFAQGAFVPPSPICHEPRRAVNRRADKGLNVINNKASAKRMLDAVAFSQPGMHVHALRVRLERLSVANFYASSSYEEPTSSSASEETVRPARKPRKSVKRIKSTARTVESTRILRSMRHYSGSDDECPLTYYVSKNEIEKPSKPDGLGAAKEKANLGHEHLTENTDVHVPRPKRKLQSQNKEQQAVRAKKKMGSKPGGKAKKKAKRGRKCLTENKGVYAPRKYQRKLNKGKARNVQKKQTEKAEETGDQVLQVPNESLSSIRLASNLFITEESSTHRPGVPVDTSAYLTVQSLCTDSTQIRRDSGADQLSKIDDKSKDDTNTTQRQNLSTKPLISNIDEDPSFDPSSLSEELILKYSEEECSDENMEEIRPCRELSPSSAHVSHTEFDTDLQVSTTTLSTTRHVEHFESYREQPVPSTSPSSALVVQPVASTLSANVEEDSYYEEEPPPRFILEQTVHPIITSSWSEVQVIIEQPKTRDVERLEYPADQPVPVISSFGIPEPVPSAPSFGAPEPVPSTTSFTIPEPVPSSSPLRTPEPEPSPSSFGTPEFVPFAPSFGAPEPVPSTTSFTIPAPVPSSSSFRTPEPVPSTSPFRAPEPVPSTTSFTIPEPVPFSSSFRTPEPVPSAPSFGAPEPVPSTTSFTIPEPVPSSSSFRTPEPVPSTSPFRAPELVPSTSSFRTPEPGPSTSPFRAPEPVPSTTSFTIPEPVPSSSSFRTPEPVPSTSPFRAPEPVPSTSSFRTPGPGPSTSSFRTPEQGPSTSSCRTTEPVPSTSSFRTPEPGPSTSSFRTPEPGPSTSSCRAPEPGPYTSSFRAPEPGPSTSSFRTPEPGPSTSSFRAPVPVPPVAEPLLGSNRPTRGPRRGTQRGPTEAPVYYPTPEEFSDLVAYYQRIAPKASAFGMCKVVPPPLFQPECKIIDTDRFIVTKQYLYRFFNRFGEATRQICAIRAHLAKHGITTKAPVISGLEVNLPKMFKIVQKYGGFNEVTRRKKWTRVAESMNVKLVNPETKLDRIYLKYMLPYDILTNEERQSFNRKISEIWSLKYQKLLRRAKNPLHMKKVYTGESDSSSEEDDSVSNDVVCIRQELCDVQECAKSGPYTYLPNFKKANLAAWQMFFTDLTPSLEDVERLYWKIVQEATEHIVVASASVESEFSNVVGFTSIEEEPFGKHGWNLKNVCCNKQNVLRSLGVAAPINNPVLHLGMVLSTNCWHCDPHGIPWVEYLHEGSPKIWYGIPEFQSEKFRAAAEKLCPSYVQDKTIWMPSDILMIPPDLLMKEGIKLTRTVQQPGEFIFIFPKAYSSAICTGLTFSESAYFAVQPWLSKIPQIIKELRDSCEPMMFSLEHYLITLVTEDNVTPEMLQQIKPMFLSMVTEEIQSRSRLLDLGVVELHRGELQMAWTRSLGDECDICRRPLYLSMVKGKFQRKAIKKICLHDAELILEREEDPMTEYNFLLETMITEESLNRLLLLYVD